jgi:hypothetical protein
MKRGTEHEGIADLKSVNTSTTGTDLKKWRSRDHNRDFKSRIWSVMSSSRRLETMVAAVRRRSSVAE